MAKKMKRKTTNKKKDGSSNTHKIEAEIQEEQ